MKQWISNNPFNLWSKAKWELSLDMLKQRSWDLWISNFGADKERWRMVLREGKSGDLHPWRLKALPSLCHHCDRHGGVSLPLSSPWAHYSGRSLPLCKSSPPHLNIAFDLFIWGEKWVKNGVRESKERDINVTMEREYHIISGTNPLRVLRSSSAVFYPFFVEFFIWFFVFYFLIWFYWFFPTHHYYTPDWWLLTSSWQKWLEEPL